MGEIVADRLPFGALLERVIALDAERDASFSAGEATAGVDVNLPLLIAALDASIGRNARLQASPGESPLPRKSLSFQCEY
jgi:hypothetical protein